MYAEKEKQGALLFPPLLLGEGVGGGGLSRGGGAGRAAVAVRVNRIYNIPGKARLFIHCLVRVIPVYIETQHNISFLYYLSFAW